MLKEADLGNAFTVIEVFVSGKIKVRLFSSFLIPRRGLKVHSTAQLNLDFLREPEQPMA